MLQYFVVTLLKWMKYKNRLTFAYYSITFWDLNSSKPSKNLTSVKSKTEFFKIRSNIKIPFIMIPNSDFLLFFPVITGTPSSVENAEILRSSFPVHGQILRFLPLKKQCLTKLEGPSHLKLNSFWLYLKTGYH